MAVDDCRLVLQLMGVILQFLPRRGRVGRLRRRKLKWRTEDVE